MIGTAITFIVGAGGSCNYGLPSANRLRREAETLDPSSALYRTLVGAKIPDECIEQVKLELRADRLAPSIDVFLEARRHRPECMQVGRALTAILLGDVIARTRGANRPEKGDWLGWLLARMRQGTSSLAQFLDGNKQVRFVTFNFDSRIEERLAQELRAMYPDAPPADFERARHQFAVVHVHGRLPDPPTVRLTVDSVWNGVSPDWINWLSQAASEVKVVHDDIDQSIVEQARQAVRQAYDLCFLGFGYGPENVQRLDIAGAVNDTSKNPRVFGSAYGVTAGDLLLAKSRLTGNRASDRITLGRRDGDCLSLLEDFYVCRD
ncbi:MAG: hypothetical protein HOP16_04175 [Acidobacteria bacterium]|nr:hypothetical protein [Acidobacteriota bacterium]